MKFTFDPVAFHIGPVSVHWYGIMYLLSFGIGYFFLIKLLRERKLIGAASQGKKNKDLASDITFVALLGVLLGGRIGYALLYNSAYYFTNPEKILFIWDGGMSFHGGLIGVMIGLWILSKKRKIPFLELGDIIATLAPIGIFLVRIGNFINAELYGRITDIPWCIYFPQDPENCRHPSQLYEALLEGLLLLIIMVLLRKRFTKDGVMGFIFLMSYGALRFIGEFFREPDLQIGYLFETLTLGQIFSIIMIGIGGAEFFLLLRKKR